MLGAASVMVMVSPVVTPSTKYWFSRLLEPLNATPSAWLPAALPSAAENVRPVGMRSSMTSLTCGPPAGAAPGPLAKVERAVGGATAKRSWSARVSRCTVRTFHRS